MRCQQICWCLILSQSRDISDDVCSDRCCHCHPRHTHQVPVRSTIPLKELYNSSILTFYCILYRKSENVSQNLHIYSVSETPLFQIILHQQFRLIVERSANQFYNMSKEMIASMTWRRALKHFLPPLKPIDISPILNAAALAPTSFGVQPFQIYVVTSAETKKRIAPVAYNQPQVTDSETDVKYCDQCSNSDLLKFTFEDHGVQPPACICRQK